MTAPKNSVREGWSIVEDLCQKRMRHICTTCEHRAFVQIQGHLPYYMKVKIILLKNLQNYSLRVKWNMNCDVFLSEWIGNHTSNEDRQNRLCLLHDLFPLWWMIIMFVKCCCHLLVHRLYCNMNEFQIVVLHVLLVLFYSANNNVFSKTCLGRQ